MVASSFGSWTSPITSDLVVAASIRLEQIALDGGKCDFRSALSRARFAWRDPFQRGATATARAQAALDGAQSQDGWTTGRLRSNVSFTQRPT